MKTGLAEAARALVALGGGGCGVAIDGVLGGKGRGRVEFGDGEARMKVGGRTLVTTGVVRRLVEGHGKVVDQSPEGRLKPDRKYLKPMKFEIWFEGYEGF